MSAPIAKVPDLEPFINEFVADEGSLTRLYTIEASPRRRAALQTFWSGWQDRLAKLKFDDLGPEARVDYTLLRYHLEAKQRRLSVKAKQQAEEAALLPFAAQIIELEEARRRMEPVNPEASAALLFELIKQVGALKASLGKTLKADKVVAYRASQTIGALRGHLREWFDFYNLYDPSFTWWVGAPYRDLTKSLAEYGDAIHEQLAELKPGDTTTIIGTPIGAEALQVELESEMIPYTPDQLIAIANEQFAWCEAEMKKASREMGYGDDWKKALEHVKGLHVEPGKQPELIRSLAVEAIKFVEDRNLVTVPPLAKETWRMSMMSPERQKISPFFLGGEEILVSYPTDGMAHDQKMMSMRGNNIHFSRATVQHELIPGHHLQGFISDRSRPYRQLFGTPFYVEGWALYWEMLLWDLKFPRSPEDRVGMLFWRMHRCARIIFSLNYHLGKMTPNQCVDFLVDRVGHERANAEGEVRRSIMGGYGPLYQIAYMIGGLQIRSLHKALVESGKWTNRDFHDTILRENTMPIGLLRTILLKQDLTPDWRCDWRF